VSDTPITDAAFDAMQEIPKDLWALRESMRDLERQRNQLLEALEVLTLVIGLTPIAGNKDALQESFDIARAAIAKAKGEAQ
jgi:hypothetical protein